MLALVSFSGDIFRMALVQKTLADNCVHGASLVIDFQTEDILAKYGFPATCVVKALLKYLTTSVSKGSTYFTF
jgi:hypothetical protein